MTCSLNRLGSGYTHCQKTFIWIAEFSPFGKPKGSALRIQKLHTHLPQNLATKSTCVD
jgi:hypothetical protein